MIDKLIEPVSNILDKFVADKDLKTKLSHELEKEIISLNKAQLEVNKVEAKHSNIFVSGWRPAIGWICGFSIGYHFILEPVIQYILIVNGIQFETPESSRPQTGCRVPGLEFWRERKTPDRSAFPDCLRPSRAP